MAASVHAGDVIAKRYRMVDLIEEANGGFLWNAHDQILRRPVGVHLIEDDDPRADSVLAAARDAARFVDRRNLRVLDGNRTDRFCYVVHEWGRGTSLDLEIAASGPLAPVRAAWLVSEVADSLASAHARGLVHGRLIPENLLVDENGEVRIIGFGVQAALFGLGEGSQADDVTALVALLYCALTGRWPGEVESSLPSPPRSGGKVLRPRQVRAGVPRALDRICDDVLIHPGGQGSRPAASWSNPMGTAAIAQAFPTVLGSTRHEHDLSTASGVRDALLEFLGEHDPGYEEPPTGPIPVIKAWMTQPGEAAADAVALTEAVPPTAVQEATVPATDDAAPALPSPPPLSAIAAAAAAHEARLLAEQADGADDTDADDLGAVEEVPAEVETTIETPAVEAAAVDTAEADDTTDGEPPASSEQPANAENDESDEEINRETTPLAEPDADATVASLPVFTDQFAAAPVPLSDERADETPSASSEDDTDPALPVVPDATAVVPAVAETTVRSSDPVVASLTDPDAAPRPLFAPDDEPRGRHRAPVPVPTEDEHWPWDDPSEAPQPGRRRLPLEGAAIVEEPQEKQHVPGRRLMMLGLGVAGLALAVLAGSALYQAFTDTSLDDEPSAQKRAKVTPEPGPIALVEGITVTDFDPQGDPDEENPEDAPNVVDGDLSTSWSTMIYQQQFGPGGIKDGVGLVADLGGERLIRSVTVEVSGGETTAELFITDEPLTDPTTAEPAGVATGSERLEFTFPETISGYFATVWITEAPQQDGGFRATVTELEVMAQ